LRFSCVECGNCCTGPPGYVWVCQEEIKLISQYIGRTDGRLADGQLRRIGSRHSLTERPNGDCVFLERLPDGRRICQVYPVRPLQCRTWPFWNSNLESQRSWAQAGQTCPGINCGQPHTLEQIEQTRTKTRWW
jgi:Fe-S-cluster containining protein